MKRKAGFISVKDRSVMDGSDNEDPVGIRIESVAENSPHCHYENRLLRQPCQDSMHYGSTYIARVLNGDDACCNDNFRVDKRVFHKLCEILQAKGLLCHTSAMRIEEQLAIFLFKIGNDQVQDLVVQELFRRSDKQINHYFRIVLTAILKVAKYIVRPPSEDNTPAEIMNNPELFPYFKNCMGSIEMTYLPIKVDVKQPRFCNRKGLISQKVMAACSFDYQFQYILAGWEGAASHLQVLMSALENNFLIPKGKYYLVDASYTNMPGFIAPYRGVRQTFKDDSPPQNAEELFNFRLSMLRNTTKQIFEDLKERFPILKSAARFIPSKELYIVCAVCAIHNLIQRENRNDLLLRVGEQEMQQVSFIQSTQVQDKIHRAEASAVRDSIATAMWNDYRLG